MAKRRKLRTFYYKDDNGKVWHWKTIDAETGEVLDYWYDPDWDAGKARSIELKVNIVDSYEGAVGPGGPGGLTPEPDPAPNPNGPGTGETTMKSYRDPRGTLWTQWFDKNGKLIRHKKESYLITKTENGSTYEVRIDADTGAEINRKIISTGSSELEPETNPPQATEGDGDGNSDGDSGGSGSGTKPPKTAGDFSPGLGSFDYPPKQDGAIAFYIGENANGKWTKSIMPSGAVIMQVGDNKPDRIGWVVPGSTTLDGMVDGGSDTNPLKDFIGGPGGVYPGETVDPSRIQITETGAVLQRKGEGGGYYRIGWISPDLGKKYAGYYSNVPDEVKGGMQSGDYDKNPYVPGNPGYEGAGGDDDQSNSTITKPFTDVEPKDGLDDVTGLPEDQFKRVYPEGAPQYGSDNEPEDPNLRSLMGTKTEEEALKKLQSELGPNDTPKDNWDASAPENQGVTDPIKSTWVDGSGLPTVGGGFDPLTPEEQGSDGGGGKNAQMM